VNLLDHNFPENQLTQLRNQRIHFQKIGRDLGRPSWDDWQEIRRVLHQLKQPTFFTRDDDFYHPKYRHSGYYIVFLDVLRCARVRDLCCNQPIMCIAF